MLPLDRITIFSDGSVQVKPELPIIANRLCIVSWLPTEQTYNVEVNAIGYQDEDIPRSKLKGHTIPVLPAMRDYLYEIQDKDAADLVLTPNHLWINRDDSMAECIGCGYGNFLEIINSMTTIGGTFFEINALEYDINTTTLDPKKFNWFTHPTIFGKETARRKSDHAIMNPGDGKDCYFPNMKRSRHLWIHSDFVELFPPLPSGILAYVVEGASVYGWTGEQLVPLRLARTPGELLHPTKWKLLTGSVIPSPPAVTCSPFPHPP